MYSNSCKFWIWLIWDQGTTCNPVLSLRLLLILLGITSDHLILTVLLLTMIVSGDGRRPTVEETFYRIKCHDHHFLSETYAILFLNFLCSSFRDVVSSFWTDLDLLQLVYDIDRSALVLSGSLLEWSIQSAYFRNLALPFVSWADLYKRDWEGFFLLDHVAFRFLSTRRLSHLNKTWYFAGAVRSLTYIDILKRWHLIRSKCLSFIQTFLWSGQCTVSSKDVSSYSPMSSWSAYLSTMFCELVM